MTSQIPVLSLRGTPRDRGGALGEIQGERIAEFSERFRAYTLNRLSGVFQSNEALNRWLQRQWQASEMYHPVAAMELEGIAEASGLQILDVVLLNAFLELATLRDSVANRYTDGGCTVVGAKGGPGGDRSALIAQNYDMEPLFSDYATVLRLFPENEPAQLVFTFLGVVACAGLNACGVAVCINFLHCSDAGFGTLYPFVTKKILGASRIGDAVGAATIAQKASGANYMLAGPGGFLCSVEVTGRQNDILSPGDEGLLVHTNHYLSPHLRHLDRLLWCCTKDSSVERRGSSFLRYYAARCALAGEEKELSGDLLKRALQDHLNYPYSVCKHLDPGVSSAGQSITNAAILLDVGNRKMEVALGNPCEENFVEIGIDEEVRDGNPGAGTRSTQEKRRSLREPDGGTH